MLHIKNQIFARKQDGFAKGCRCQARKNFRNEAYKKYTAKSKNAGEFFYKAIRIERITAGSK